ncbi:C39 family peptidase [Streptococcus equinus]|uniref:C39 family peptidase n=1 Tax=Streptococcus equinus TaxID=1335 RepID=UPI0015F732B6|nr:C39 family peptidase [Streptococcus equinus]QMS96996.1 C39 family peptidase [Streptococcus equinus]
MKILKNNLDVKSEKTATGLAPVSGYEPWSQRTLDSIKDSIVDGIPILARLHSAADYPCDKFDDNKKLDMESHAILIVGYDDEKEEFLTVDPWHSEWNGNFGGLRTFPYSIVHKIMVNCSMDKCTRVTEPSTEVTISDSSDMNKHLLNLKVGFYTPRGYIMDKNETQFTLFEVQMTLKNHDCTLTRKVEGNWHIGDFADIYFPVDGAIVGSDEVSFSIKAVLQGNRPYKYEDVLNYSFKENVNFKQIHGTESLSQLKVI